MIVTKLKFLIDAMPLSDPTISDIRVVRAIDKERIKYYSFMPYALYAETMEYRNYHRIFDNSFSEPLTRYDAGYGRASLVSNFKMEDKK